MDLVKITQVRKKWYGDESAWPWNCDSPTVERPRVITLAVPHEEFMEMACSLPSVYELPVLNLAFHEAGKPDTFIIRDFDNDSGTGMELFVERSGYDYARYKAMVCM